MSRELSVSVVNRKRQSWIRDHAATIASLVPILLVFGYVQWTYFNETPSFTAPLELLGAILTPVLAGIFPVLLLVASRAQGLPVSGAKLSLIASNPLVLGLVVFLSFAGLLAHGLIIWQEPLSRGAALTAAVVMFLMIGDLFRRRVFSPLLQIQLRYFPDSKHSAKVSLAFNGKVVDSVPSLRHVNGNESDLPSNGYVLDFRDYQSINFDLPKGKSTRLQINAHRISVDFEAAPLDGWLSFLEAGKEEQHTQLDTLRGLTSLVLPASQQRTSVQLYCKTSIPNKVRKLQPLIHL